MQYSSESKGTAKNQGGESAETEDPRSKPAFWTKWAKDAWKNKYAARHRKETRLAWDEYEKNSDGEGGKADNYERSNPAYYAACKTLEPAYYAKTPKTIGRRRPGVDDGSALRAARYARFLGDHAVEGCEFDECFSKVAQEFIHGDKVTTQICRDQSTKSGYDEMGNPIEVPVDRIYPKAVLSHDWIHTPSATSWSEIEEIGYKFCLSKDDALARFPKLKGINVQWKAGRGGTEEDRNDESVKDPGEFLEGWECYCKRTKHIYIISPECVPGTFLDVKADDWDLCGFFPSPRVIIGSCPQRHLYPTPPFVHLSGTIKQLHLLYSRVFELIDGLKRRALVDGSCPELLRAFDELEDQEFITVDNLGQLVEKAGNVNNLVWYLPVQELVNAVKELVELDGYFNQKFDQYFGIPDILRGVSDPTATAAAEQIAAGAAHDRFRYQKMLIQKLASDTIEMMVDLMLKVYSPERIMQVCRYSALTQQEQQTFWQDMALLQDDEERLIRIDIRTDSMSFVNERQENQERNAVVQTVVGGIKEIGALLAQGQPQYAAVALHTVVHALDGLRGGEEFIEEVKAQTQALIDQAMQPPAPPPPPPPDPKMLDAETRARAQQVDELVKMREADRKDFEAQLKAQDTRMNEAMLRIEELLAALETRKVDIAEAEMVAEETRLRNEADAEMVRAQGEAVSNVKDKAPAASITIVNAPGGGGLV